MGLNETAEGKMDQDGEEGRKGIVIEQMLK